MGGITDFHTHAFPDELAPRAIQVLHEGQGDGAPGPVLDGTVSGLLRSMDRAGVERSAICSIATAPKQVEPILRWSLGIRSPRIVPFPSVHPGAPDAPADVARIAASGLPGVKLHAQYQGFALDDRRMWPIYRAIAESGLILTLHTGLDFTFPDNDERSHPARALAVHRAFPDMRLVVTHMGGWRRWEAVLRTLAGTDVYMETSYSLHMAAPELLAQIVRKHSPQRILFGTDSPWRDQAEEIGRVRRVFPDPEVQRLVLCENAARLLDAGGVR